MSDVFLGVIAVAVSVMAVIQIAALVFAARTARRVGEAVGRLDELRFLARSKSPMVIVGANIIPLSPQAVATCRELLRRAMRAQHRMTGVEEQESSRLIAEALRGQ